MNQPLEMLFYSFIHCFFLIFSFQHFIKGLVKLISVTLRTAGCRQGNPSRQFMIQLPVLNRGRNDLIFNYPEDP
jgi:hypothetical protein